MREKIKIGLVAAAPGAMCIGIFVASIRLEEIEIPIWMHIGVMFVFLFMAYTCLQGSRGIKSCEKVMAEFITAKELGGEKIKALFDRDIEDFPEKNYCIARFECDGKVHYDMVEKSKAYGYMAGQKREIYVRREKDGVKTVYLVLTKRKYVNHLAAGIYFAILTILWIVVIVIDIIK